MMADSRQQSNDIATDAEATPSNISEKLAANQQKMISLKRQIAESNIRLEEAEGKASEAAKFLAEQETALTTLCQSLENQEKELQQKKAWLQELDMMKQQKAITLSAAQKEMEEVCQQYQHSEEQTTTLEQAIQNCHQEIEKQTKEMKHAYYEWQEKNHLLQQEQKIAADYLHQLEQMEQEVTALLAQKEENHQQQANHIAEQVLASLRTNDPIAKLELPVQTKPYFSEEAIPKPIEPMVETESVSPALTKPESTEPSQSEASSELFTIAQEMAQARKAQAAVSSEITAPPEEPLPSLSDVEDPEFWQEQAKKSKKGSSVLSYILCIVIALILAFLVKQYVFQITEVAGESMEPTLLSGDRLFTCSLNYLWGEPERGDIIVFPAPDRVDKAPYIKRVIALPGEHLIISDNVVSIDGIPLEEPYLAEDTITEGYIDTIVPEGKVFVMGDNRMVSHDSRSENVSFIDIDEIMSKALWRIYPFDTAGNVSP